LTKIVIIITIRLVAVVALDHGFRRWHLSSAVVGVPANADGLSLRYTISLQQFDLPIESRHNRIIFIVNVVDILKMFGITATAASCPGCGGGEAT
jgi:hypothetical protein